MDRPRVLVVEDNPLNMELVFEILTAMGFIAEKAMNGEDAVKKTKKEFYDLIIMDIALPGINGVEATKLIKNMHLYKNVPVIALTAHAMKGDKERFLEHGFDDYIPKPIEVPVFMNCMEKYNK